MTISRRTLLGTGAALGLLTACGSNTGRGNGQFSRAGRPRSTTGTTSTARPAPRPPCAATRPRTTRRRSTCSGGPAITTSRPRPRCSPTSGPDVFEVNGPTLDQIQGGQVADLTALLDGVKDDFNPAVLAPKTYDGKIWGIPQVIDTQFLYYRKSLLAAAGVQPPATLDELVDAAKALTRDKVKGLFLGNDGGAGVLGGTPLYAAGLSLVTDDGRAGFDDPAAARTLGKLRQLYADKSLLLGAPVRLVGPVRVHPGAHRDAVVGAVGAARRAEGAG